MKAYYVKKIKEGSGKVVIDEITGGVPTSTPVIIKCASTSAASNKLNVGASTTGTASGNLLTGVYFCNPNAGAKHTNVIKFEPTTMRVLGKAEDGSLAFVNNVDLTYIPANTAYITVSESAPSVLKVDIEDDNPNIPGDLSGDGTVSGQDLVMMTNLILSATFRADADLNNDGTVSGADYVKLVNLILGK